MKLKSNGERIWQLDSLKYKCMQKALTMGGKYRKGTWEYAQMVSCTNQIDINSSIIFMEETNLNNGMSFNHCIKSKSLGGVLISYG